MWIFDELSYNKSFENYDHVGDVAFHNGDGTNFSNAIPLAAELKENFSQDIKYVTVFTWPWDLTISTREKNFLEPARFMQPEGAEIFSIKMINGAPNALTEPNTIIISETLSKKLFGDADAIGQVVRLKNLVDVRVGGVYKDFQPNTDLHDLNLIGSWEFLLSWMPENEENQSIWTNYSNKIIVQLKPGASFEELSAKIKDLKKPHLQSEQLKYNPENFVHPMSKWHLYSKFENRMNVTSDQLQFVWLYGVIGAFVLILACINFMNLSTARSEKRAKEVGIRKTMGSLRQQLIVQFLSESFITVAIATVISIVIVLLALPYFNDIAAKRILFPWTSPFFWMAIVCFMLIAGLLAGSYPALYLSSFKPIKVLKSSFNPLPRKVLVVLQFTVSITLIVGTIVVYQQIQFAKDRPVGYTREGLIKAFMITPELYDNYDALQNELLHSRLVENVAQSSGPITDVWKNAYSFVWEGKPDGMESKIAVEWVSEAYGDVIGWKIVEGRNFSKEIASDSSAVIITQTAARCMGMKTPVDQVISWEGQKYHVIGVVEDIVMRSPYEPVRPTVFLHNGRNIYTINIRLNPNLSTQASIEGISSIFQRYNPAVPFIFSFVDDDYSKKFASEVRVSELASMFAVLAILISLLGLFGLSSFVAEQRTKEIGIRKVIGASVTQLWTMLTKSFAFLIVVSCLISFPIAWYALSTWLTRFEYRIDISPWIFPAVIAGALIVTLATVSYQALRAALANPVDSLKSE
jgi:putative ABC transport system permease protein